jgi:hypothetical protein
MPISRWNVELPAADDLTALPKGVVVHWTGGGHRANAVDLSAYHLVVEADGNVVAGKWPIAANLRKLVDDKYAKHTGGFNSFRIGISAAGMKDYRSRSAAGSFPLKEVQVRRMMEVAAYFIALAGLDPMNPWHLCSHREVWTIHRVKGTQNHIKTDIEFLPFRPDLKPEEVGDFLRQLAADAIRSIGDSALVLPEPLVLIDTRNPPPAISTPEPTAPVIPITAPVIPITSPVESRSDEGSLWSRFVGRLLG